MDCTNYVVGNDIPGKDPFSVYDPAATYVIANAEEWPEIAQKEYRGDALHYAGINIPALPGDFKGRLLYFRRK